MMLCCLITLLKILLVIPFSLRNSCKTVPYHLCECIVSVCCVDVMCIFEGVPLCVYVCGCDLVMRHLVLFKAHAHLKKEWWWW
jgi:hypothetical protein